MVNTNPDQALGQSLAALAALVLFPQRFEDTLTEVAGYARTAIPGADGVGVTVLEAERADTMVASEGFVRDVDALQYGIGEGPCLLAVEVRAIQMSGSLGGEPRWPRFGPQAGRLGVHSALSLPLLVKDRVVGALNIYSRSPQAFDTRSVRSGELFARSAAVTVANALLLEESRRLAGQLDQALISHAIIERAIGIGMSRSGGSAEEIFEQLRERSRTSGTKLLDVARQVVDSAGRAGSRHRPSGPEGSGER
jgi:GAF domain-containing protein